MDADAKAGSLPDSTSAAVVLLVEDFDPLRTLSALLLRSAGYIVFEARDAGAALERFEAPDFKPDLLITDVCMPGMNGVDLVHQARQRHPRLPVLMLSGYATEAVVASAQALSESRFLQKPFLPPEFLSAVAAALVPSQA